MKQKFILAVDDNPNNLSVISQALRSVGWQVRIAVDGEDALAKVSQKLPELILLDVQMPGMNGFEVCQHLKANEKTASIPVIFMTALADTASKLKGLSLGAVDYITKPFEQEEVIARVRIHLQLSELTQTLEQQVHDRTLQLTQTLEKLQNSHLQVIQSEKMSALGNLVAGIAHEINNPVSCIVGNVEIAQAYLQDLLGLIDLYHEQFPEPGKTIMDELAVIDLPYLREDFLELMKAMKDGGERIAAISQSLRTFSRSDTEVQQSFDLQEGIESTLLILRHRLKDNKYRPAIKVTTHYGSLPEIQCFPGQLNQVFMNILANAIDVFDEMAQQFSFADLQSNPQEIMIQTSMTDQSTVKIGIRDNGKGMSEEVKARIFDHLFTTKGVGKGTGLGLAIAHQIIVEKHHGSLNVYSEPGQGTEFCICLPICAS
jgi:signal transduction histidine kinase